MTDKEAKEPDKTIDELLEGFEPKKEEKPQTEFGEVVDFVKEFKQKEQQRDVKSGIDEAVSFIKTDESITGSDRLIKGFLNALADENPNLLEAFNQRHSNPGAWDKMLKWAQTEAKSEFSTDTKLTDDVNAAKAAASGQMTDEPTPAKITSADLDTLSEFEFAAYKDQLERNVSPEKAFKLVK